VCRAAGVPDVVGIAPVVQGSGKVRPEPVGGVAAIIQHQEKVGGLGDVLALAQDPNQMSLLPLRFDVQARPTRLPLRAASRIHVPVFEGRVRRGSTRLPRCRRWTGSRCRTHVRWPARACRRRRDQAGVVVPAIVIDLGLVDQDMPPSVEVLYERPTGEGHTTQIVPSAAWAIVGTASSPGSSVSRISSTRWRRRQRRSCTRRLHYPTGRSSTRPRLCRRPPGRWRDNDRARPGGQPGLDRPGGAAVGGGRVREWSPP